MTVSRSGFACLVGRPNAGKSTLANALVGEKVAITSSKPQTTRRVIRGVRTTAAGQLVLVDTPGVHRPRTLLGERLNALVYETWSDVDVVVMCLPADEPIGPGDRFIARRLADVRTPVVAAVTKTDLIERDALAAHLIAVAALGEECGLPWAEIVPVSAVDGHQVDLLADLLLARMPEGPALFPDGEATDEPVESLVAELVREAALEGVHDELPHSIAVVVEEIVQRDDRPADRPLIDVRVSLFVERDSQKGIIIGRGGERLREIGSAARAEVERLLGMPVHLDLRVKVAQDWQRDPRQLRRLGFDA